MGRKVEKDVSDFLCEDKELYAHGTCRSEDRPRNSFSIGHLLTIIMARSNIEESAVKFEITAFHRRKAKTRNRDNLPWLSEMSKKGRKQFAMLEPWISQPLLLQHQRTRASWMYEFFFFLMVGVFTNVNELHRLQVLNSVLGLC